MRLKPAVFSGGADAVRRFVFLQMPQSRFPRLLGQALTQRGHRVLKINFCGGDVLHWPGPDSRNYYGTSAGWPFWLNRLFERYRPTDLILIGDRRPYHQLAVLLARDRDLQVHVFDEGYKRPGFVTLEENGVNGRSELPRQPRAILEQAAALPDPEPFQMTQSDQRRKVTDGIRHHLGNFLLWPVFPFYRTHRPRTMLQEFWGLAYRYYTAKRRKKADQALLAGFLGGGRKFFFFPLQLSADTQIQCYSDFLNVEEAIAEVLCSFKCSAPPEAGLVVKSHPLDCQTWRHRRFTLGFARALGLGDRVCYVDEAVLDDLVADAEGLVLVNSTTGLYALERGRPVFCLGSAIYAMPGLAEHGRRESLDRYWTRPVPPEARLTAAFIKLCRHRSLVNGNFYTEDGMRLLVDGCLRRLGVN